jgi:cation transport ATPase
MNIYISTNLYQTNEFENVFIVFHHNNRRVIFVVSGALVLAVVPPLLFHGLWSEWLQRALIFLVISCPCALVISILSAGIGGASRCGILVKGSNYLEALAGTEVVVFDKTGTLTKGTFQVTAIHPEQRLLEMAALAESYSDHSISKSLKEAYARKIDNTCGVKILVLCIGALGLANMWEAVFADVGVAVIAIGNASRALRLKGSKGLEEVEPANADRSATLIKPFGYIDNYFDELYN